METCCPTHAKATQWRLVANHRYPRRNTSTIPGSLESHTSGRAHQTSRAKASTASAPPDCLPSDKTKRNSRSKSFRESPSNAPTRGSCSGASSRPRRLRIGASQRAIRVQNLQSASKKSQPRAWRPLLSVNSDVSEIMARLLSYFLVRAASSVPLCESQCPRRLCVIFDSSIFPRPQSSYAQPLAALFPNSVMTLPRNLETLFSAPTGIRRISSNKPVIVVRNSSMVSSRSRV